MKKKPKVVEETHKCTFTVTIAKAIEAEPLDSPQGKDKVKTQVRPSDNLIPTAYFHCSYQLLPGDSDITKADVVTFGNAAKLYTDSESRVLRTYNQGRLSWVAWNHSHEVEVTQNLLLKLFNYNLELRVWDTKDKMSTKARFDRPKGFKLPPLREDEYEEFSDLKSQLDERHILLEDFPSPRSSSRGSFANDDSSPPGKKRVMISEDGQGDRDKARKSSSAKEVNVKVQLNQNNQPEFNKLMSLASNGIIDTFDDDDEIDQPVSRRTAKQRSTGTDSRSSKGRKTPNQARAEKRRKNEPTSLFIQQNGLACITLPMSKLFGHETSIVNTLNQPVGSIAGLVVSVTLDCPLLSSTQRDTLNPLIFSISTINNLPERPLKENGYKDVYACYKLYSEQNYTSRSQQFSDKVYLDDKHVVLLGILPKEKVIEYFQGPPLKVEIHDRERKPKSKYTYGQAFGTQKDDALLGNVSYISGINVERNPFLGREPPWDPFGVATVDFSEFLTGEKALEFDVPLFTCPLPDVLDVGLGRRRTDVHIPNYLEKGSTLKARAELWRPVHVIVPEVSPRSRLRSERETCLLNRIIYVFDYHNPKMLRLILSVILRINAEALGLHDQPKDLMEAALSTYKLTEEEQKSQSLDIVTGFQVIDGEHHIFVLEGLHKGAISYLWDTLPQGSCEGLSDIKVYYNSDLLFSKRLYLSLDVDITRVRLHKPLSEIVQQPLLYVRDMIPKPCFEAVVKLHELTKIDLIMDAVRNKLFPSAESIVSLGNEFGIPLSLDDIEGDLESNDGDFEQDSNFASSKRIRDLRELTTSRAWTPIQYRNSPYEDLLQQRHEEYVPKDFIQTNKLQFASRQNKHDEARISRVSCDLEELHLQRAHNYSCQSMNSALKAKEKIAEILKQDPGVLYTYNKNYQSGTFSPVDIEQVRKEEKELSKKSWQTENGFVYPGKKTFLESNQHSKKPDFARLDELQLPWKENILHANTLRPSVDRVVFPWSLRHRDFDVVKPAEPNFGLTMPTTIYLAGDTLKEEEREAEEKEKKKWEKKLVVNDPILHTHRVLKATELRTKGPAASCQLSKLEDILKGRPKKFSLTSKGLRLEKIPSLSVLLKPSAKKSSRFQTEAAPANGDERKPDGTYIALQKIKPQLGKHRRHSIDYFGS